MRYLILFCFLFFFGSSYAIIPNSSTEENNVVLKEENNSTTTKQQKIINRKNKRQLKKQTQKLKWQVLKNALKFNKLINKSAKKSIKKSTKKFDKHIKKDKKPIYWASWLSALLGTLATGIILLTDGILFFPALFLLSVILGIGALITTIVAWNFIVKNAKTENKPYNETFSILFTIIGGGIGIAFLLIFISLLIVFSL